MLLSVQCPCGYQSVGNEQTIVASMQQHCSATHAADISPESVLAYAHSDTSTLTGKALDLVEQLLQAWAATSPLARRTAEAASPRSQPEADTSIASVDLSTRGFMEAERVGGYFVTMQVDNLSSCLLSVSGTDGYRGYYDLRRLSYDRRTTLVDDERVPVPVSVTKVRHPKNYSVIRIEIWAEPIVSGDRLAPYMRNPFK